MNITTATKVVTTKTHTAAFSADEVKTAALSLAKKGVGLSDDQIASSKVEIAADGEVTVELIEVASEAAATDAPAPGVLSPAPAAIETPAAHQDEPAAPAIRMGFGQH